MRRVAGAVALAALSCVLHAGVATADGPGVGPATIVSVGDSIPSGEGGRWAGNTGGPYLAPRSSYVDALGETAYFDDAYGLGERIAGCHRARSAEVHIGGGVVSANLACSGARTHTHDPPGGPFKPGLDFYHAGPGDFYRAGTREGQALALQEYARYRDVKLVLVSIGGNDVGFPGIAIACATAFIAAPPGTCRHDPDLRRRLSPSASVGLTLAIARAILRVHEAMASAHYGDDQYTILVQDYPSAMPSGGGFRYGDDERLGAGCPIGGDDATWFNAMTARLNTVVAAAVRTTHLRNLALLDVADALRGHRLCERGVFKLEESGLASWHDRPAVRRLEWVNQLHYSRPYAFAESLHPNYWGHLALRNCLRLAYHGGAVRGGVCTPGPQRVPGPARYPGPLMELR